MEETELLKALSLAGNLAMSAQQVIDSPLYDLSNRIVDLEKALEEYNNHIFKLIDNV